MNSDSRPGQIRTRFIFLLALTLWICAGCAVGPNYSRPKVAIPAQYKEAADGWKIARPNDQYSRGAWWEVFGDKRLNELVERATRSNQTIAQYAAAYRQARALVPQARADGLPQVNLTGDATRTGSSFWSNPDSHNGAQNNVMTGSTIYSAGLKASWEPDFWRKIQRNVNSQSASAQSAEADLANAQLATQAELAQNYFKLRQYDAQQKLLDGTVAAYQKALAITQHRYAQGAIARSEVIQAQTQLSTAQTAALENQLERARMEHALAALIGEPASTFSLAPALSAATLPQIPSQLPSALLERRPDIASKERQMAAANEKIGIAMAGFFPKLTLEASGGFRSSSFSQWLSAPAQVWSLGPQLVAMLFDGGLQRARTEAARGAYEHSVADYRQTVLSAFKEVEDQLAALRLLEAETVTQQQAATSSQQALTLINNRYKAGMAAYLEVMTAQTVALSAQRNLTDIEGRRMAATVELIKALGGGWIDA